MRTALIIRSLVVILVTVVVAAPALAHAKLLTSKPSAGEMLQRSPDSIELEFSVGVQPPMSSIVVKAGDGSQIITSALEASADVKMLRVALPDLSPGEYRVEWRALSADDHMINGEFAFQVTVAAEHDQTATPEVAPQDSDHSSIGHDMPPKADRVNWSQSLVRWLMYIAMMMITGGIVFRLHVVKALSADIAVFPDFDRRLSILFLGASAVLIVSLLVALILQVNTLFESFGLREAYSVLTQTTFGTPWLLQFSTVIAVAVLVSAARLGAERSRDSLLWLALGGSLLMLFAPSLSGHARAASAEYSFSILSDWLHLLAGSVWVGGLMIMAFGLPVLLLGSYRSVRLRLVADLIHRFNRLAISATVLLALTGLYNSWIHVESFSALVTTLYGRVLLTKVAITIVMIVLGGINSYVLRPRIIAAIDREGDTDVRSVLRSIRIEAALAVLVLLLAAILAFLPPAREHLPLAAAHPAETNRVADRNI